MVVGRGDRSRARRSGVPEDLAERAIEPTTVRSDEGHAKSGIVEPSQGARQERPPACAGESGRIGENHRKDQVGIRAPGVSSVAE